MVDKEPHSVSINPPSILLTTDEANQLSSLANSGRRLFPRVAHFLESELDRGDVEPDDADLPDVVKMGSHVRYRDNRTGQVRGLVLVYPHEADVEGRRISVLTLVGAALIGMSAGQTMEFKMPDEQTRLVTVLAATN
ncbi:GreA/GreB family elongation factor [Bradyrhizobium sp. ISRA443]|uniref:GreA/GreB family elongation factor n=1 Tax=unclassified Bradyrhizobium TaxID=2631580 RepID=UPI00247AF765|nr:MULTISPECIES: GreA/GreB family elongation factor [unclassified Bradyrhizobium]WGR98257.1 GreA/GreB family elongation factor [Bradyrhizobium sp. ISRA436]WGS05145.1 GreA/GreB family elongation factor [Bradyrhizobium sp. ISRA437]WGS12031.1 GreA/GreB family elongation factor [Bradyrhizobium sp. ISRA443]